MDTKAINQNLTPIKNRLLPPCKLREESQEPQLNDYKEIKILGKGGFGVVSLGQHLKTKKFYALKKMTKSRLTKTVLKAIQSEIEIMMPLDHENIIKLYDYFEDDNSIVLILEYADGQQLYEKLSAMPQQRFDEQTTLSYARQLLNAIAYLHNKDPAILHRDIKPENLMLNKDKKIKLVDFGWSNYFESDQIMRKTVCGTAAYLSPEMILGTGNDKMHDMWCIGVLIYEFLTGRDPFSPDPSQFTSQKPFEKKLYQNILHKAPSFPKNFPPLARDLVEKLLQKKIKDRLDVNQVLQHPWITQEFTENSLSALQSSQEKVDSTYASTQAQKHQESNVGQVKEEAKSPAKNQEQSEKLQKLEELNNELQTKNSKLSQESVEKENEITILKSQKEELLNSLNRSQEVVISLESQLEIEKKQWQNQVKLLEKGMHDNSELKQIQQQLDQKELELINLKMTSSEQITKLTTKLAHVKEKRHLLDEKLKSIKTVEPIEQEGNYQSQDIVRKSITMRQSLSLKQTERLCPEDGLLLRELTKILVDLTIQIQNYVEKAQEGQDTKLNAYSQIKQQDSQLNSFVELKDQQEILEKIDNLVKKRQQEDNNINQQIKQVQEVLNQKKQEKTPEETIKELNLQKKFVEQLKKEVGLLQIANSQMKTTIKELEMAQE